MSSAVTRGVSRSAVAVSVAEPMRAELAQVAAELGWRAYVAPNVRLVMAELVRTDCRTVVVQVGEAQAEACHLIRVLHASGLRPVVVAMLTEDSPTLEREIRQAGVTCCLSPRDGQGELRQLALSECR